jgi:hypothetical protein
MAYTDFLLRITNEGGPAPADEIESLLEQCRSGVKGRGLLGARKSGSGWKRRAPGGPTQYAVVFYCDAESILGGCVAEIVDRWPQPPKQLPAVYTGFADIMESWWTLRDARRIAPGFSLIDIPGRSTLRKTADAAFRGGTNQVTFLGWSFDGDPRHVLCEAEQPALESAP